MKSVLSYAIQALALVALLAAGRTLAQSEQASGLKSAQSLLVGSQGHLLATANLPGGLLRFDHAIAVGDLILTTPKFERGIHLVTLWPGLEFNSVDTIDTSQDPDAGEKLMSLIAPLPVGSVVIAAVRGDVHPEQNALPSLDRFPITLGAELSPFRAEAASWALISYRLESGWRTIAESYSEERAVHLAFTLAPNPSDYQGHRSEVFYAKGDGAGVVELLASFELASDQSDDVAWNRQARAGAVRIPSITMRPSETAHSSIVWQNATLPPNASFRVALNSSTPLRPGQNWPRFSLYVDGAVAGWLEPDSIAEDAWVPWVVDLGPNARHGVTLELRTEVSRAGKTTIYFWGQPRLSWGVTE